MVLNTTQCEYVGKLIAWASEFRAKYENTNLAIRARISESLLFEIVIYDNSNGTYKRLWDNGAIGDDVFCGKGTINERIQSQMSEAVDFCESYYEKEEAILVKQIADINKRLAETRAERKKIAKADVEFGPLEKVTVEA